MGDKNIALFQTQGGYRLLGNDTSDSQTQGAPLLDQATNDSSSRQPSLVRRFTSLVSSIPIPRKSKPTPPNPTPESVLIDLWRQHEFDHSPITEEKETNIYHPLYKRAQFQKLRASIIEEETWFRDRQNMSSSFLEMDYLDAIAHLETVWESDRSVSPSTSISDERCRRFRFESTLCEFCEIYTDEIARCEDSEYFRPIIMYDRFNEKTRRFHAAEEMYEALHKLELKRGKVDWCRSIDKINEHCMYVQVKRANCKLRQPMDELMDLFVHAVWAQMKLESVVEPTVQQTSGCKFYTSGFKPLHRAFEKKILHPTEHILDLSRVLISFSNMTQLINMIEKLLQMDANHSNSLEILDITNNFSKETCRNWQDVLIHVRFADVPVPMICEIQLCLESFLLVRRDLERCDEFFSYRVTKELKQMTDVHGEREQHIVDFLKMQEVRARRRVTGESKSMFTDCRIFSEEFRCQLNQLSQNRSKDDNDTVEEPFEQFASDGRSQSSPVCPYKKSVRKRRCKRSLSLRSFEFENCKKKVLANENDRAAWTEYTEIEVWAHSQQKWVPGIILSIDEETNLVVRYRSKDGMSFQLKRARRSSTVLRSTAKFKRARQSWEVGCHVNVFSESARSWFDGEIVGVGMDDGAKLFKVKYNVPDESGRDKCAWKWLETWSNNLQTPFRINRLRKKWGLSE